MYCIFRSYKRTKVIKFHCTNVCLTLYITFAYVKLKPCLIPGRLEAGCDEAGRGCLAGPVFAAAVILPEGFDHPLLDDSKKMTKNTGWKFVNTFVTMQWPGALHFVLRKKLTSGTFCALLLRPCTGPLRPVHKTRFYTRRR
jgi:hypothetical protein